MFDSLSVLNQVGQNRTILLWTRDTLSDSVIREILEPYAFTFISARDVENAFFLCMRKGIDLVIADAVMTKDSGLDLCRRLKSDPRTGNTPVLLLSALSDPESRERIFRVGADDYLLFPPEPMELKSRVRNLLRVRLLQFELEQEKNLLSSRLRERSMELEELTQGLVASLEQANTFNDDDTGAHIVRVCQTAEHLAQSLNLSTEFCGKIRRFASLHDIGKVGLPDRILKKEGPLTEEEREEMKLHTLYGYELLKTAKADPVAQNIAYTHHERFDGTGYPRGLAKEEIPIEGRIVALVDVFDALRSARCYKPEFSELKALDLIEAASGTHFDPRIVEVFIRELPGIREIRNRTPDT